MKHFLTILLLVASIGQVCAAPIDYEQRIDSLMNRMDSLIQINNLLLNHLDINTSLKDRYKLYPTENIYTLLELDTKTGIVKQVQWSLDSGFEGYVYINAEDLNGWNGGYGSGTFELYPTKNMYQFILLNQTNGNTWHIQWGIEKENRWIRMIF